MRLLNSHRLNTVQLLITHCYYQYVPTYLSMLLVVLSFRYVPCHSKIPNLQHKSLSYENIASSKITMGHLYI